MAKRLSRIFGGTVVAKGILAIVGLAMAHGYEKDPGREMGKSNKD